MTTTRNRPVATGSPRWLRKTSLPLDELSTAVGDPALTYSYVRALDVPVNATVWLVTGTEGRELSLRQTGEWTVTYSSLPSVYSSVGSIVIQSKPEYGPAEAVLDDLLELGAEIFEGIETRVEQCHDPDRSPPDYLLVRIGAFVESAAELVRREEELLDRFIDRFPDTEDYFVIVCHRTATSGQR